MNTAIAGGAVGRIINIRDELEEVVNLIENFFDPGGEGDLGVGEVKEGIRVLVIRGGELGILQTFVNDCYKFVDEAEPSLTIEDSLGSIERGG